MHDIPLNDTQRIFADKNHNLVYKFLHEKNLPASEYYDSFSAICEPYSGI